MVLQQMRSMKMFVFWFVAIVFIVGFVFLSDGLNVNQINSGDVNLIAEVNGEKVQFDVYNRYVNQLAEMERQRFQRDQLTTADYDRIEGQAWDGMVADLLVRQEAERLGIRAGDEEIVATLTQNPPAWVRGRFTAEDGRFDAAAFQSAINDPNYNWGPDEQYLRAALPSLKLEKMVRARATVSEAEVRNEFARRNQRVKVRYVGVPLSSVDLGTWTPSDTELRAYYDQHPDQFPLPAAVKLEVLRVEKKPSEADVQDALEDVQQILDEQKSGETFASLAEIYSDDPSAARGGDLGWVLPSALPPGVKEAASALAAGETSPPVRTSSGIVLVHADSVRVVPGGREVRLRQIVVRAKMSGDTLDSLRTRVLEAGEKAQSDFAGAARDLGVTPTTLDRVEKMGFLPGIGFSKPLVDWAFEASPGAVSAPVATDDAMLIARLVEKSPEGPRPFDEAREQARSALLNQTRKDRARAQLDRVLAALRAGSSLDAGAAAAGLAVQDAAPFAYYEPVAGIGVANEFTAVATTLEPGRTSGVIETASGSYVLQVIGRDPFDETAYQNGRTDEYQRLLGRRESEAYEAWLKDLRERAKIVDHRRPRV